MGPTRARSRSTAQARARARSTVQAGLASGPASGPDRAGLGPLPGAGPGPTLRCGRRSGPGLGRPVPGGHPVRHARHVISAAISRRGAISGRPAIYPCRTAICLKSGISGQLRMSIRARMSRRPGVSGRPGRGRRRTCLGLWCRHRLGRRGRLQRRLDLGRRLPAGREHRRGQREVHPFLGQAGDVAPRHHDLEDLPVDLPVAQLRGACGVPAQIGDVQPVTQVIQHQARLAPVVAHRPRLPQRVEIGDTDLLAPVPGRGHEPEFLRRRAGREQRRLHAVRTQSRLVGDTEIRCHQPQSHDSRLRWVPCQAVVPGHQLVSVGP